MLFRQMKYFVAIVECNSFTEAAERCFISQSAISQQMNALEAELGTKLTKRDGRKFALTAAGEYFFRQAKQVLKTVEQIGRETARIGADNYARLNIGYLSGYDGAELPRAIVEFSQAYPDVVVNVIKGTHEDLYHALRDGEIDVALNDQRRAFSDEYENYVLSQSPAYIDISFSHPLAELDTVTLAQAEGYPCILVAGKSRQTTEQDFYANTLGIGKQFVFAESLDEARLMAMSGRGYLLVESVKNAVREPLVRREVRRNDGSAIVRTYCAFWQKAKTNCFIEAFADILRSRFTN